MTPISTRLAEEIAKVNIQYQEGAITANELCCKIHSILFQNLETINKEFDIEKAYWDKQSECTCSESFMSKADCKIHGISEQLNRSQME